MRGSSEMGVRRRHGGRRTGVVLLVAAMALAVGAGAVAAGGSSAIQVKKPWARTSPMAATNGAVYMVLKNTTKVDHALVSASVPSSVAMEAQIHETVMGEDSMGDSMGDEGSSTTMAGGGTDDMGSTATMQMREVEQIDLPAKSKVELEPGGYHIMLMNLAEPLTTGAKVKVTLEFDDGTTKTVKAVVKK